MPSLFRIVILVKYWSETLMICNDLGVKTYEIIFSVQTSKVHPFMPSQFTIVILVRYCSKTSPRLWWSVMICKWKYTRETRWKKFMRTSFLCKPAKCKKMEKCANQQSASFHAISSHFWQIAAPILLCNLLFPDIAPPEHNFWTKFVRIRTSCARVYVKLWIQLSSCRVIVDTNCKSVFVMNSGRV